MFKHLLYVLSFFVVLFYVSCKKEKLRSPEASFLVVNNTVLNTTFTQGTNSHKITDIWLYVNDDFKGVFPIGSVMPIVSNGNAEIVLFPGIQNNGISATRLPYIFYKSVKFTQSVEPGKTYTYTPNFEYADDLNFNRINENFENSSGGGIQFTNAVNTYTLISDPGKTYGGTGTSLLMTMTDASPNAEIHSGALTGIPLSGSPVYLELNYKCNQPFNLGVICGSEVRPALFLNPKEEWNKVYISLTSVINTQPVYPTYKLFIAANKSVANPEIYIDNVKLITF